MLSTFTQLKVNTLTKWFNGMYKKGMSYVPSISRDFANMGFLFTRPPSSNLYSGPVLRNTTNNTDSFVYTYANWLYLSMKDWKLALYNKLPTIRLSAQPYFHSFKAADLMKLIELDPDPKYSQKYQQMLQARLPNWQTAFKKFTKTVNWKIHEPSGMTFWLAFPLLSTFNNLPYGFTELVSMIMSAMQSLHDETQWTQLNLQLTFKLPFTLHLLTDESGSFYMFSKGPSVNSYNPWLPFQVAFAMYNSFPIPNKGVHSTILSRLNCLIWMWGDTMYYSLLDLPPTFQANSAGKMKDFYKSETNLRMHFYYLYYLAEIYSKNSMAVNNIYEWLQCVISAMSEQQPKIHGYKPELIQTYDDKIPKVSLVAAITDKMITPEILEDLIKSVL